MTVVKPMRMLTTMTEKVIMSVLRLTKIIMTPTKVEDVDRFMADLAAAAAENAGLTPAREDDPESGK